jgi:hypothetical protein
MDDLVEQAFGHAEAVLQETDGDFSALSPALQVVVLIVSAQGVLDNGGYRYFFERDWPGQPSYEIFAQSYEAIGCRDLAAELRRVVATFPFPEPHLKSDERVSYISDHYDEESFEVPEWGEAFCGDPSVWAKLAAYCRRHRAELGV